MSKAGIKLMRGLRQLNQFFRGRKGGPMRIWTPDEEGDMVGMWADTPEEFYQLLDDLDRKRKEAASNASQQPTERNK